MVSPETIAIARPPSSEVLTVLQQAEKQRDRRSLIYENLLGTWRLLWVAPKRRGGQYLPGWLAITLTYTPDRRLENRVQLGPLALVLRGPVRCDQAPNILAFDFLELEGQWGARTLYRGPLRGGPAAETAFFTKPLREHAFFVYFYVGQQAIAARGRGGGLALWYRP